MFKEAAIGDSVGAAGPNTFISDKSDTIFGRGYCERSNANMVTGRSSRFISKWTREQAQKREEETFGQIISQRTCLLLHFDTETK